MKNSTILKVEHLSKYFKSGQQTLTVLNDVSFEIEQGSACAIVGPSGSGKTTLIGICAGLERPSQGSVLFNGVSMHLSGEEALARIRNELIGFIFQSFQLLPSLTALENVMVPAEIRGENHARNRAGELLERVGLENRLHHYPIQLSGGEQQRVAIARAFMNRPKILFADEPTGNLDAETAKEVVRLIFEINATTGTTLMLVTHDRDLTERARAGRLRPADISGATFTISNLGMYHADAFSAIIIAPQAAILAVGQIADRVVPVDGRPAIRPMMTLILSSDHRVVDGARAAAFLKPDSHGIKRLASKFTKGFFGTVGQGLAKVELSSYSGTIRILKRD